MENSSYTRLQLFRRNVLQGLEEMVDGVVEFLESVKAPVAEALGTCDDLPDIRCESASDILQLFKDIGPTSRAAVINGVGFALVAGVSAVVIYVYPVVLTAAFGKSSLLTKIVVVVSGLSGAVSFVCNQFVHLQFATDCSISHLRAVIVARSRVTWSTVALYGCSATMLPLMALALHHGPWARYALYLDLAAISLFCYILKAPCKVPFKTDSGWRHVRLARWEHQADATGSVMFSSVLLWALWWPTVLHLRPL